MARAIWVKHLSLLNETFRAARIQAPFTRDSRFEYESIGPRGDGVPDSSRIAQKTKGYVSWIAFKSYIGRPDAPEWKKKNFLEISPFDISAIKENYIFQENSYYFV